jgi:hypothetical protein
MAKITMILDASDEFARRELGAFLREDGEALEHGKSDMTIEFSDVDEGLARWLISSLTSLHGLSPDVLDSGSEKEATTYDASPSSPKMRGRTKAQRLEGLKGHSKAETEKFESEKSEDQKVEESK